jgi:hypothetical protein
VASSGRRRDIARSRRDDEDFTLSGGRPLADAIRKTGKTGKTLTTIYVSCNDQDDLCGLRPGAEAFPNASVRTLSSLTIVRNPAAHERRLHLQFTMRLS